MATGEQNLYEQFIQSLRLTANKIKLICRRLQASGYDCVSPALIDTAFLAMLAKYSREQIAHTYIRKSYDLECWSPIYLQQKEHFQAILDVLFSDFAPEDRQPFIDLFLAVGADGKPLVTDAEQKAVFEAQGMSLRTAIQIIHHDRQPVRRISAAGDDEYVYTNLASEFADIDVWPYVTQWQTDVETAGGQFAEWDMISADLLNYPAEI